MASASGSTSCGTVTETVETVEKEEEAAVLNLKLHKPKSDKKVKWTNETVDNEHLNKKKSKCCCIYEKPRIFGESSSEDEDHDDCTDHCKGHKKKCYQSHNHDHGPGEGSSEGGEGGEGGAEGGLVS